MSQPPLVCEVRWTCPSCGRFIAESALRSWDEPDFGAYYGVIGVTVADCGRCGEVEPRCIPVKTREWVGEPVAPPDWRAKATGSDERSPF